DCVLVIPRSETLGRSSKTGCPLATGLTFHCALVLLHLAQKLAGPDLARSARRSNCRAAPPAHGENQQESGRADHCRDFDQYRDDLQRLAPLNVSNGGYPVQAATAVMAITK